MKLYIQPEIILHELELTAPIAESDPNTTVNPSDPPVDPGKFESPRINNIWDEEE